MTRFLCSECENELRPEFALCPSCGRPNPFVFTKNTEGEVISVHAKTMDAVAPAANLPALFRQPQLPTQVVGSALPSIFSERDDFAALAPNLPIELIPWARSKLETMIRHSDTDARKARRRGNLANKLGSSIGAALLTGAAIAAASATAPVTLPLVAMGALGIAVFGTGLLVEAQCDDIQEECMNKIEAQRAALDHIKGRR